MIQNLSEVRRPLVNSHVHTERIGLIDSHDFSSVAKKIKKDAERTGVELSQDYLDRGVLALKQYYAIAMLDPANAHAVSEAVDPFWHAHMLFSKDYTTFCNQVVGEYMHHVPLDHDDKVKVSKVRVLYMYTIVTLDKLFHHVDRDFWPKKFSDSNLRSNTK